MDPVIETRRGKLRGRRSDGATAFKGVPYAAPPFGANRLRPPRPVDPWDGVRDALTFGPKSPQVPYPPGIAEAIPELVGSGEDCLTLNIWTPEVGAAGRPVMVWIPGGMFEFHATGATAFYDGSRFARDGVVCVTINYRVGAEGFLYLGDGIANLGLFDQIAALEWVQENIRVLGGEPGNVTVFGESAGAMSVATLLTMPRANGLFHRAIVQSGNTPNVTSAATAERIGRRLAEMLGVEATRDAIAATSPERILQAQAKSAGRAFSPSRPSVLGRGGAHQPPVGTHGRRADDPGASDRAHPRGGGRGHRPAGRIEHGGNAALPSVRRGHRPHHRGGPVRDQRPPTVCRRRA